MQEFTQDQGASYGLGLLHSFCVDVYFACFIEDVSPGPSLRQSYVASLIGQVV